MGVPTTYPPKQAVDQSPVCSHGLTLSVPAGDTTLAFPAKKLMWLRDGVVMIRLIGDSDNIKLQGTIGVVVDNLAISLVRGTSNGTEAGMELTLFF